MAAALSHAPVMLSEAMGFLAVKDGGIYVDGTFGRGGYSAAILGMENTQVWAIDRDPEALEAGQTLCREHPARLHLVQGRFGEMDRLLESRGVKEVDGVALDLGVSSPQIDDPARGFSFRADGPLDMRMEKSGPSAEDVVNTEDEDSLARIIAGFGEERFARRVARALVAARREKRITRTGELAAIVRRTVPKSADGMDPATRSFQALRLYVNDELAEIENGLPAAEKLLKTGGRLVVVSFHSLEDRRVKDFMRRSGGHRTGPSRHLPQPANDTPPRLRLLTAKPLRPSAAEIRANPRAAAARLRAAERVSSVTSPESLVDVPAV